MLILVILVLLCLLLMNCDMFGASSVEPFFGMSFEDQNRYYRCCQDFGCHSWKCQRLLVNRRSDLRRVGMIYSTNLDPQKIHTLYRTYNYNTRRNEYYYKLKNQFNDWVYRKIPTKNYIYNGDILFIDGARWVVNFYRNNQSGFRQIIYPYYGHGYPRIFNFGERNRYDLIKQYGILRRKDLPYDEEKFVILYERNLNPRREYNEYFIKDRGTFTKLPRIQKIYHGDEIEIPTRNGVFVFEELESL